MDGAANKLDKIAINLEYKRFIELKNCIEINDKKLNQIICQEAARLISPTNEMTVDELLRLFTGAYANKIKMSMKPAGEGCQAYIIADSNSRLPLWYSIEGKGNTY